MLDDSEAGRAVIETAGTGRGLACGAATGRQRALSGRKVRREVVVVEVLRDFIAGNIEAGCVGEVEDVKGELEVSFFLDVDGLAERGVGTLLEGLAEDVALAGGEAGFIRVRGGNCAAHRSGREQRKREAGGIERSEAIDGIEGT